MNYHSSVNLIQILENLSVPEQIGAVTVIFGLVLFTIFAAIFMIGTYRQGNSYGTRSMPVNIMFVAVLGYVTLLFISMVMLGHLLHVDLTS